VKARVEVFLKPGVLDVQGKAIEAALHALGYAGASQVRVGRVITLEVDGDGPEAVRTAVTAMADTLLSNQVIETYKVEVGR
jgi:phosphoribosylformylglycinamidine synthase